MKKIFLIFLILFNCKSFSQSSKEFLLNDNEKINNSLVTNIIAESKDYGYNLYRDNNGDFIFHDGLNKYLYLIKNINLKSTEGFPEYFMGNIIKRYFFTEKDIDVATPNKIETEINILENEIISSTKIINYFSKIKNDIEGFNDKGGYSKTEKTNKVNFKSFSGSFYDLLEINTIEKPCLKSENDENKCVIEHCFSNGVCYTSETNSDGKLLKKHSFFFNLEDKGLSKLIAGFNKIVESDERILDKFKYTIGDKDIRNINQYDLESMVETFLEDCKINNIIINDKNSINATFETLDGDKIALAYGYGDDTSIIIKVDPVKWGLSNIVKRWYIIYHELGHDVLNLEHGQGGKMMFNFADKEYSWDDFFIDKDYMMNSLKDKVICCAIETVKIGTQEWTVKNLDVSRYRNGDIIPEVKDPKEWAKLTTGAWCYHDNNSKNGAVYGKLYNWYAVADPRGIAPEGFHIPSDDEWKTLNDYIDSEKINGVKKKVLREKHQYELDEMMESRFKGLPGGARLIQNFGCYFTSIGFDGAWWSSSENVTKSDLYNTLNYYYFGGANDYSFNKQFGFSVRCIKD